MIRLSLFAWMAPRALVFAAILGLSAVAGGACSSLTCAAVACLEGLVVHLDGDFEPGTFDVALIEDGPAGSAQFMTCSLSVAAADAGAARQLLCSSAVDHSELGTMIQIRRDDVDGLTVVVSSSGTEIGRQSFQPAYMTREINGPGCGTCTSAAVHVTVP
jgi:hypothetical protein